MFTGIIEEVGRVVSLEQQGGGWQMDVTGPLAARGAKLGDSIAVNGTCLTVTHIDGDRLRFGLAPETLKRTNLGDMGPGTGVNLERALPANGRIDGHFVQGHVDGTGVLREKREEGDSLHCTVATPPDLLHYMVPKGFIAVDGTSLTIIDVLPDAFTFMLVAFTQQHIALPARPVGARVNLEVDLLAKYAEKFMAARAG